MSRNYWYFTCIKYIEKPLFKAPIWYQYLRHITIFSIYRPISKSNAFLLKPSNLYYVLKRLTTINAVTLLCVRSENVISSTHGLYRRIFKIVTTFISFLINTHPFLKMFIFGYLAIIEFPKCCCVPNFIKIGWFSLRYGDLTTCNMADVVHLEFSKFRVYVTWPLMPCYCASLCKISLKSAIGY